MYDPLWEEHPKVKQIKAKAKADAEVWAQEAKAQADAEAQAVKAEAQAVKAEAQAETARLKAELEQLAEERAKQLAEERAKQLAEGTMKMLRGVLITFVHTRFPTLTALAQAKVAQVDKPDVLSYLLEQLAASSDENEARLFLRPTAA